METADGSNAPIGEMRRLTRSNRLTWQLTAPSLLLPQALVDAYLDLRGVGLNAVDYFHTDTTYGNATSATEGRFRSTFQHPLLSAVVWAWVMLPSRRNGSVAPTSIS